MVEAREALAKAQRDARRQVVDLGCGAGRDFPAFEERNIDYLGVDASEGMLTVARERFPGGKFRGAGLVRPGPARAQLRRRLRQTLRPSTRADARFAERARRRLRVPPAGWSPPDLRAARQGRGGLVASTIKRNKGLGRLALAGDARRHCGAAGFESVTVPTVQSYEGELPSCLSGGGPLTTTPASKTRVRRRVVVKNTAWCRRAATIAKDIRRLAKILLSPVDGERTWGRAICIAGGNTRGSYKTAACNSSGACPAGGGAAISRRLSIRRKQPRRRRWRRSSTLTGNLRRTLVGTAQERVVPRPRFPRFTRLRPPQTVVADVHRRLVAERRHLRPLLAAVPAVDPQTKPAVVLPP